MRVSKRHINRVRSAHGLSRPKKTSRSESQWQDSAGSLVLLAAAQETGLGEVLNEAVADRSVPRLAQSENTTRQQLLLTLLFMNLFEVRRPCDLRGYTGDGLALLSGRQRALRLCAYRAVLDTNGSSGCRRAFD